MTVSIQKRKFKLIADQILGRTKRGIRDSQKQQERLIKRVEKTIEDQFSNAGIQGGQTQNLFGQEGDFPQTGNGDSFI